MVFAWVDSESVARRTRFAWFPVPMWVWNKGRNGELRIQPAKKSAWLTTVTEMHFGGAWIAYDPNNMASI